MRITKLKLAFLLYCAFDFFIGGYCGGFLQMGQLAAAQAAATTTTLSAALNATDTSFTVGSATNFAANSIFYVDREAMCIASNVSTFITVSRGCNGTQATGHLNGSTGYVGVPNYFKQQNPVGTCTSANEAVLPVVVVPSGTLYNCIAGYWMVDNAILELPPGNCIGNTANSTGTNGLTVVGASNVGVVNIGSSTTGTNTHTYNCVLDVEAHLAGKTAYLKDVVFKYGVQTTTLGTQVAVLASGTMNSQLVFQYIDFPAPGASETASTVTPVRADAGTLVITPVVASFNVATTTAGGFYTAQFTPATPIMIPTGQADRRQLQFSVALLNTATSATITNSPGLTVHYAYIPD